MGLTLSVVHGCSGRLLPGNHNKVFSIRRPLDILNLVVENRDVSPILTFMNSHILQRMFSIVTLASGIIQTLGPYQDCVTWWCWQNLNVLSSGTCDIELRSLQGAIEIIDVNKSIVIWLREHLSILPSHEVYRAALRTLKLLWHWAKNEAIELAVIHPCILLDLTVYLGQRRKLRLDLHLWLLKVARLIDLNDVQTKLSGAEPFLFIKHHCLWSIFCRVFPLECSYFLTSFCVPKK